MAALLTALPIAAVSQAYPEPLEKYVNDFADILTPSEEKELRDMLVEVEKARGVEFTFVSIALMSDYGHDGAIEPFATGLFNSWGIGNAERDDGLLLLVAKDDRKVRIEVGLGYGSALNVPMKRIIDNWILPKFRNDDFGAGILDGAEQIIFQATDAYPGNFDRSPLVNRWIWVKRTLGAFVALLFLPFAWVGWRAFKAAKRRYPRKCPNDGAVMGRVLDEYEHNYLREGQLAEENIGSVDYDVWKCPTCEHQTIEAYPKWRQRFGACRECGYKTVESDVLTIRSATKISTGLRCTTYNCRHCKANYAIESTIPVVTTTSSSSGSFGGGSSGGGGASGSW